MRRIIVTICLMAAASGAVAASLEADTAAAFQRYVRLTEQRINSEATKSESFLWIDTLPANRRGELQKGLQQGGVVIERLETREDSKKIEAPDGLIHHWIGVVFVPKVSVKQAVALMQDYNHHSKYFAPAIAASKMLEHDGNRFKVALRFHVKKIITVTMDTDNDVEFFHPSPDRAHSRIRSSRVTEIADAGTPQERAKPAGQEHGFMWNLNTYWRFLERDGGTYIQCESLTLSRDVPFALAWIIRPIVTQMPKESLTFTMGKAREALVNLH
ncbi:MAG TPA: hypothetical protein VJM31_01050 [Vicinamibacterales bacterium]|nr:hypothetical protein [Vicinamibacterales bacterium]